MSTIFLELVGKRFDRLLVLNFSHKQKGHNYYKCKCSCGTEKVVRGYDLTKGKTKSCGCLNKENQECMASKDIIKYNKILVKPGSTFGKLTVVKFSYHDKDNIPHLECKCCCGTITYPGVNTLIQGRTNSCGCASKLRNGISFHIFNLIAKKNNMYFKEEDKN